MKKLQPYVSLRPREITWGTRYLIFSLCFLGPLIQWILQRHWPAYSPYLNTIYYTVNLVATVIIFRHFLWDSLLQVPKLLCRILLVGVIAIVVYWIVTVPLETTFKD